MDSEDEEYIYLKLRTKGKNQTYLPKPEFLELKSPRRHSKCLGPALEFYDIKQIQEPIIVSNDIWFQLANYIAPEDIKRYSLICRQSANSVNTRTFWLQIYIRYCQKSNCYSKKWVLQLPEHLQMAHLKNCDRYSLRQKVIQALFYCYPSFKTRLKTPYTLEMLEGRTFVSSWYKQEQCVWIACYKFNSISLSKEKMLKKSDIESESSLVVEDWECLAEEKSNDLHKTKKCFSQTYSMDQGQSGSIILVIYCGRFIPFPSEIICNNFTRKFSFATSRELLATNMRSKNLELDLISSTGDQTVTVKYSEIRKFEVLPWWHPNFRIFNRE